MKFDLNNNFQKAVDYVLEKIANKSSFCLYLHGDLGAGKTHFVKALIKKIYPEVLVHSPTFTLVNLYQDIYHMDLYRVEEVSELEELGIEDMDKMIVEWPKNWKLGRQPIELFFHHHDDIRELEVRE